MARHLAGCAWAAWLVFVLPGVAWSGEGLPVEAAPSALERILAESTPAQPIAAEPIAPVPIAEDAIVDAIVEQPLWSTATPPEELWTFRYQTRWLTNSVTSYEFGVPEGYEPCWSPLSRLEFPINALWHGFQVGLQRSQWEIQFEWLTPVNDHIQGNLEDRDWQTPGADFTDLGVAPERWISGQMLNLDLNLRLWDRCFGLPVDCWGTVGFRWQRFDVMAHDASQLKSNDVWLDPPDFYAGDVLSFDQQYWLSYLGGQLRTVLNLPWAPPIHLTFQGDWSNAQAYNIDHHLIREGDRYTFERTHGDACHLALTAETPLTKHLSVGLEADYLGIDTHGRHHLVNLPMEEDETWTNGVHVWSEQTWLSVFIGFRI